MDPTHRVDVGVPAPGFAEAWSRQRFHRVEVLFHDFQEIPINNGRYESYNRLSTSIRSGRFASLGHEWELGMTIRRESRRFGLDTSGPATVDFCLYNMSDAEIAIESKIEVSGVNTSTKIMRVGKWPSMRGLWACASMVGQNRCAHANFARRDTLLRSLLLGTLVVEVQLRHASIAEGADSDGDDDNDDDIDDDDELDG